MNRPPKPPRRRSGARRILFVSLLILTIAAGLELGSFALFWIVDGSMFTYARAAARRAQAADEGGNDAGQQQELLLVTAHPYLGTTYSTDANGPGFLDYHKHPVTRFGFVDSNELPIKRKPGQVIVAVLGGSVAFWLSILGDQVLEDELQRSPEFAGKEIVILRLALGGFKQPQQLMALNYVLSIGCDIDIAVNLDGLNEAILPIDLVQMGVYPFYPTEWYMMYQGELDLVRQREVGRLAFLREQREQVARSASGFFPGHSVTMQLIWRIRDRSLHTSIQATLESIKEAMSGRGKLSFGATGPTSAGFEGDRLFDGIADHWMRCSILMGGICRSAGIQYVHFLQPNQHDPGSKPIGAAERKVAVDNAHPTYLEAVPKSYPRMSAKAAELRAHGVAFDDLRSLFADVPEPLYIDTCCHLNPTGCAILVRRMAATIIKDRELARLKLQELVVPDELGIGNPFDLVSIPVTGRFSDGEARDISQPVFGTTYRSSDPHRIEVYGDGRVRALAQGSAEVTVSNGRLERVVRISARWAPVTSLRNPVAGSGGLAPELECVQVPEAGQTDLRLRVRRARGGARGLVLLSRKLDADTGRVPATGYQFPLQCTGTEEVPGSGQGELLIPLPKDGIARGQVVFVEARMEDPGAVGGVSISNALRITVQ